MVRRLAQLCATARIQIWTESAYLFINARMCLQVKDCAMLIMADKLIRARCALKADTAAPSLAGRRAKMLAVNNLTHGRR